MSTLNAHLYYHRCIIDGVFSQSADGALCFHEASELREADVVAVQAKVRARVLRLFERRGLLSSETAADMGQWAHAGGFSVDATVRARADPRISIQFRATDRAGRKHGDGRNENHGSKDLRSGSHSW